MAAGSVAAGMQATFIGDILAIYVIYATFIGDILVIGHLYRLCIGHRANFLGDI